MYPGQVLGRFQKAQDPQDRLAIASAAKCNSIVASMAVYNYNLTPSVQVSITLYNRGWKRMMGKHIIYILHTPSGGDLTQRVFINDQKWSHLVMHPQKVTKDYQGLLNVQLMDLLKNCFETRIFVQFY